MRRNSWMGVVRTRESRNFLPRNPHRLPCLWNLRCFRELLNPHLLRFLLNACRRQNCPSVVRKDCALIVMKSSHGGTSVPLRYSCLLQMTRMEVRKKYQQFLVPRNHQLRLVFLLFPVMGLLKRYVSLESLGTIRFAY